MSDTRTSVTRVDSTVGRKASGTYETVKQTSHAPCVETAFTVAQHETISASHEQGVVRVRLIPSTPPVGSDDLF